MTAQAELDLFPSPPLDLREGDCLDVLPTIPDGSVAAVVTDPPYGLDFMGRAWDGAVPGVTYWRECLRVLKPGGHLLAFGGTRTAHRLAVAVEDAGFEIRDTITWLYGSGFPKSRDVGKDIDKARDDRTDIRRICRWLRARIDEHPTVSVLSLAEHFGMHRRMVEHWAARDTDSQPTLPTVEQWETLRGLLGFGGDVDDEVWRLNGRKGTWGNERADRVIGAPITRQVFGGHGNVEHAGTPVLAAARQWQGWGTALKPASEPIIVARKPLTGTVAATVLAHGTGGLNVDGCRVESDRAPRTYTTVRQNPGADADREGSWRPAAGEGETFTNTTPSGRWPANVVLTHAPDCADLCVEGCPVAELDAQSGTSKSPMTVTTGGKALGVMNDDGWQSQPGKRVDCYGDQGGASRFFPTFRYQAKAPTSERPKIDGRGWPTVKPLALMRWLVRLVTPPDGLVLDPFTGTGPTLLAAQLEGFPSLGIEADRFAYRLAHVRFGWADPGP